MKKILYIFAILCFFSFSSQAANSLKNDILVAKKSVSVKSKNTKVGQSLFDWICGSGSTTSGNVTVSWMTFCHSDGTTNTVINIRIREE